jgi:hypothetical protein
MKQVQQIRVNACGMTFTACHHAGAITVLRDLRGVVIRCHPCQVPIVNFAMSEQLLKLPVVGDLSTGPQFVKYMDISTGVVEYLVDGLAIPTVQTQIEDQIKGEYNDGL